MRKPTGAIAPLHAQAGRSLRHVVLETGHVLRTWDTSKTVGTGMMTRTRVGYELRDRDGRRIFNGEDFGPSPMHADDADGSLRALLGFLTLRPGDADDEYFADYDERQQEFSESSDCELLAFLYSEDGEGEFVDVDDDEGEDR